MIQFKNTFTSVNSLYIQKHHANDIISLILRIYINKLCNLNTEISLEKFHDNCHFESFQTVLLFIYTFNSCFSCRQTGLGIVLPFPLGDNDKIDNMRQYMPLPDCSSVKRADLRRSLFIFSSTYLKKSYSNETCCKISFKNH